MFSEPKEKITQDLAPVTISGKSYPFSKYVIGEGRECGGGSTYSYTIRLDNFNVLIYKNYAESKCDEQDHLLDESLHKKVETKAEDLSRRP